MDIIYLLIMIGIAALIISISTTRWCITEDSKGNEGAETPEQLYSKCIGCPCFRTCFKGIEEVRECEG